MCIRKVCVSCRRKIFFEIGGTNASGIKSFPFVLHEVNEKLTGCAEGEDYGRPQETVKFLLLI